MKLLIFTTFWAISAAGRLENTYLPPSNAKTAGGNGAFLASPLQQHSAGSSQSSPTGGVSGGDKLFIGVTQAFLGGKGHPGPAPAPVYGAPSGQQSYSSGHHEDDQIAILRFNNENNGDGSYHFEYETENKINQQEIGQLRNIAGEESTVVQGSYSYISPEGQHITVNYVADENGFQPTGDHLPTPPPIPEAILKSIEFNAAAEARDASAGYSGRDESGNGAVNRQYLAPNKPSSNQQDGYKY